jgi:hypothetical protein
MPLSGVNIKATRLARDREREKEGEGERDVEYSCFIFLFSKGMTGALAFFCYLVHYIYGCGSACANDNSQVDFYE